MIDVPPSELESTQTENKPITVGARLREERLSRGIKRSEIAVKLHITNHYVKSLEANNFDKLPGAIFVKGYLKNYSELLDLNPTEIVGLYEKFISQESENRTEKVTPQKQKVKNRLIVVFSVVLFISLFAVLWAFSNIFGSDATQGLGSVTVLDRPDILSSGSSKSLPLIETASRDIMLAEDVLRIDNLASVILGIYFHGI